MRQQMEDLKSDLEMERSRLQRDNGRLQDLVSEINLKRTAEVDSFRSELARLEEEADDEVKQLKEDMRVIRDERERLTIVRRFAYGAYVPPLTSRITKTRWLGSTIWRKSWPASSTHTTTYRLSSPIKARMMTPSLSLKRKSPWSRLYGLLSAMQMRRQTSFVSISAKKATRFDTQNRPSPHSTVSGPTSPKNCSNLRRIYRGRGPRVKPLARS